MSESERAEVPLAFGTSHRHQPAGWRRASAFLRRVASLIRPRAAACVPCEWFTGQELRCLFDLSDLSRPDAGQAPTIDDQTWSDLQVDRYLALVASDCSIFGRQWLYRRLRVVGQTEPLEQLVESLDGADGSRLEELLSAGLMRPLRTVDMELSTPLHRAAGFRPPQWVDSLWAIPLVLLAGIVLAQVWLLGGIVAGMAALIASGWAQIRLYQGLQRWLRVRQALVTVLRVACKARSQLEGLALPADELLPGARSALSEARRLYALFRPSPYESMPGLVEYANLIGLYEYRRQHRQVQQFEREQQRLREILEAIARLEALGCLVRHLKTRKTLCWSRRSDTGLQFDELVSPLLERPAGLSLELHRQGILLTGKNGIGKSTLLRTVGINVLTAGAFGFCYARCASCAPFQVLTSMQIADSLEQGKSTYMAELERARQLLDASRSRAHTLVLIDEIFAGTNHLESISAGHAVLAALCERSAVIVATHDVVLAPLLDGQLRPLRLLAPQGGESSMRLEPGTVAETNGITLMADYGFPAELVVRAHAVHQWLATYLAYPVAAPPVKAGGPAAAGQRAP